jgi:hypothetical protein
MANVMRYRRGPLILRYVGKSGTVAIQQGDIVGVYAGAYLLHPARTAECTSLVGVAMGASPTTDATATKVRIAEIGHGTVFEFATTAKDLHRYGQVFTVGNNAQTLTKKTSVSIYKTATSVVAVCAETGDASASVVCVALLPGKFMKPISARVGTSTTANKLIMP